MIRWLGLEQRQTGKQLNRTTLWISYVITSVVTQLQVASDWNAPIYFISRRSIKKKALNLRCCQGRVTTTTESSINTCAGVHSPLTDQTLNLIVALTITKLVSIQLNVVTCPTYPDKFIRDNVTALHRFYNFPLSLSLSLCCQLIMEIV